MEAWALFPIRLFTILMVAAAAYYVCDSSQRRLAVGVPFATAANNNVADADATSAGKRNVSTLPLIVGVATFLFVITAVEFVQLRRFTSVVDQVESLGGSIRFDSPYASSVACYFAQIATVDLSDCSFDDSSLPALRFIHNLKSARLANTNLGTAAIREISRCRWLESLDISNTSISDDDLLLVARLRRLRSLLLNDTNITDDAVAHLSQCGKLNRLELTGTALSEDGIRQLARAHPAATVVAAAIVASETASPMPRRS